MVGATSTSRPARGTNPSLRTPLPAITNGARACTMPERTVLAAVTTLVLPVVGGGVQHAQVGRRRMVEELRDVVERVRVRVGVARRVRVGALRVETDEPVGRLVGERIRTGDPGALVAVGPGSGAAERHCARGARHLVGVVVARLDPTGHHVDDRRQLCVEQHVQRAVEVAHAPEATDPRPTWWPVWAIAEEAQLGTTSQMAPAPPVPSVTT